MGLEINLNLLTQCPATVPNSTYNFPRLDNHCHFHFSLYIINLVSVTHISSLTHSGKFMTAMTVSEP